MRDMFFVLLVLAFVSAGCDSGTLPPCDCQSTDAPLAVIIGTLRAREVRAVAIPVEYSSRLYAVSRDGDRPEFEFEEGGFWTPWVDVRAFFRLDFGKSWAGTYEDSRVEGEAVFVVLENRSQGPYDYVIEVYEGR